LEDEEKKRFEAMSKKLSKVYWMPLVWASSLIVEARREKFIESDVGAKTCLDHLLNFRRKLDRSLHIEVVNVPLVYSQVSASLVLSRVCNPHSYLAFNDRLLMCKTDMHAITSFSSEKVPNC
jgi:hypothetical protein